MNYSPPSNDELLHDITNTETEINAYNSIANGFLSLSLLCGGVVGTGHDLSYRFYMQKVKECGLVLQRLNDVKRERGL